MRGGRAATRVRRPGKWKRRATRIAAGARRLAGYDHRLRTLQRSTIAMRVLVVDDNVDSAEMLQTLLKTMGHEAGMVHDGQSALEAVDAQRPEVVLLDIGLPDMDGYEVARQIRERQGSGPRLIALTGWDRDDERSRRAGFDHHLMKPTDFGALERVLAQG
jgi:CheY-like chemotaxis protein